MIMKFNEDFLWYEKGWEVMRRSTDRISGSELVKTSAVAARPGNTIGIGRLWDGLRDVPKQSLLKKTVR